TVPGRVEGIDPTGAALEQAGKIVTQSADKALALQAQADKELRARENALSAAQAVSSAVDQIDQGETTLRQGQRDPQTGEIITAPADPQTYMPAWLKMRQDIQTQTLADLPNDALRTVVAPLLQRQLDERQHAARGVANQMRVDALAARADANLSDLANKA